MQHASRLAEGVARNRMRTEAGKMPESLISPIRNGHGVSHDRFGFKIPCHPEKMDFQGAIPEICLPARAGPRRRNFDEANLPGYASHLANTRKQPSSKQAPRIRLAGRKPARPCVPRTSLPVHADDRDTPHLHSNGRLPGIS